MAATTTFLPSAAAFRTAITSDVESAVGRVWVSVAFFAPNLVVDDASGTTFEALLAKAAARGCDVRVLAWDCAFAGLGTKSAVFERTPENEAHAAAAMPGVHVAWDSSPDAYHCHHTKDWVVDNLSFIGGINLKPVQHAARTFHDNYVRVADAGSAAAADHRVFFARRWNAAIEAGGGVAATVGPIDLDAAAALCDSGTSGVAVDGCVAVDVDSGALAFRATVRAGLYAAPTLADGREDILAWYTDAFARATHEIVVESTHIGHAPLLVLLLAALDRGVHVLWLHGVYPTRPERAEAAVFAAVAAGDESARTRYTEVFELALALAAHPSGRFTHATLVGEPGEAIPYCKVAAKASARPIRRLHSKLTVVDGCMWITGSANHVDLSFSSDAACGHTETAVSVDDAASAAAVLDATAREYGLEPGPDFVARASALARANRDAWRAGTPDDMVGSIVAIDLGWAFATSADLKLFDGWE